MTLRITILLPQFNLSGGNRIAVMYADQLAARGHQVRLVCGPTPLTMAERVSSLFGAAKAGHRPGPGVQLIRTKYSDSRLVADLPDADVLIGTWWETVESMRDAPASKGAKVHLVQGHENFPYLPADRTEAVHRLPFHKICVSEWLVGVMRSTYGCTDISLVQNPVDTLKFGYRPRAKAALPRVGTVYSSFGDKNSVMAVEATEIARKENPSLRLICFGSDKPPKSILKQPFVEFSLRPSAQLIPEIYRSCDYWLFTSRSEGFGLPILEAFAVGTPVIATRAGAAPELVSPSTGALVSTEPDEMSSALLRLMNVHPETWSEMSKQCRRTAESNTVPAAVDRLEAILLQVVERAQA